MDKSIHRKIWNYPKDYEAMGFCSNTFSLIRIEYYEKAVQHLSLALDALEKIRKLEDPNSEQAKISAEVIGRIGANGRTNNT